MSDIFIRIEGHAGRITLNRPDALNALTWEMCKQIDQALISWATDDRVTLLILDAAGDRAFCAGGDIAEMYASGLRGDFTYGRAFWRDEYRMNARLFDFPKPVVSLLQGFTMGGGVGVGCHGSHRIVGDSSRIAMPECGIGLVPDVGGSLILARAPTPLGAYLGTTGARMGPSDAIFAGFADYYVPEGDWPALIETLCATGDWAQVDAAAQPAPPAPLQDHIALITRCFSGSRADDVLRALMAETGEFAERTRAAFSRNSPLAVAATVEMLQRLGANSTIRMALGMEYRFTFRAMEHGDFIEGIRAAIIDKDKSPNWRHASVADVTPLSVSKMLRPLGPDALTFEEDSP